MLDGVSRVWSRATPRRHLRPGASPSPLTPSALRFAPGRLAPSAMHPTAPTSAGLRPPGRPLPSAPVVAARRSLPSAPVASAPAPFSCPSLARQLGGAAPLPAGRWPNQAGSGEQEDRSRALVCIWFPNFKFSTLCCSLYFEKFLFQLHSKITI